ncbi:hypothetical protein PspLS_03861 [Pyricularia sp. CBS 133598]|nr:hypothetical protein PspLS_03861 [Pyricularia sp. CBS 133598]
MSNSIKQAAEAVRSRTSEVMGGAGKGSGGETAAVANDFLHTPFMRAALPFLNGGAAGMVATTVIQPVDMIKVRLQLAGEGVAGGVKPTPLSVTRDILASGRALDLYTGLSAGLLRQAVYTTARLGFFDTFMGTLTAKAKESGSVIGFKERAAAGLSAGGLAAMIGNPADLALIRMQSDGLKPKESRQNYKSVIDALARITKNEGIAALWSGATPTVVRAMALNFGQLAFFSEAKAQLKTRTDLNPRVQTLTASAVAGFFASFFSLPFDFVKTRLQKQQRGPDGKLPYKNMIDCFGQVAKQEGPMRFYRGFWTYYVRIAPHAKKERDPRPASIHGQSRGAFTNMDADWGEIAQYHTQLGYRPDPTNPSAHHSAPTAVAFDTRSELLWVGKDQGRVAAYVYFLNNGIMEFQRHIAFLSHPRQQGPVHQFLFNETGVISLGSHNVHMAQRGGMCLANIGHVNMTNLRCMTFTSRGTSEILVAGDQDTMFVIDLNKKQITKEVPAPNHYFLMKKSKYICAASRNGCVDILDPITLKVINTWNTRSAQLNDMDVQHDFIVTCGASLKQGTYMADPYVNVFDLKNMRSFPPISFPPLVTYARMHPKMVTTSIVVSKTGQMHVVDIANPHNPIVRQVLGHTHLALFDVSPSGQAMVFTDTEGYIHVWGPTSKAVSFVDQGLPVEFETEQPNFASIPWSEDFPVNMVGLPHYSEALLSSWPADLSSDVGAPPAQFDQAYVDAMMPNGNVGLYGKSVAGTRRNQVVDTRSADKPQSSLQAPKFLSEKARDGFKGLTMDTSDIETADDVVPSPIRTDIESLKSVVPNMYHLFEIKFSKFGVDDFDFGYYNKTHHSGLENHITNSYANSLLQLLRFTPILRNLALQHAATSCLDQHCLLCELGYLCDSMEKARGASCQATNMLKMLSQHPAAANLHLLDGDRIASSSAMKIQGLLRFLLDFMSRDYGKTSPGINDLENATATSSQSLIRCDQCKSETSRPQTNYVQDLAYSPVTSNGSKGLDVADSYLAAQQGAARGRMAPAKLPSFSQILKKSIEREQVTRGWCTTCRGYQPLSMRKIIKSIPQVLAANTCISSVEEKKLWATPGWLPEEVGFIIDKEHIFCYEGAELDWLIKNGKYKLYVYSLMGLVVNIEPGPTFKPHPVAIINAAHSEPQKPPKSQWHLFNDFHVKPISTREALTFNTSWKTPLVVMFQLKAANNHIDSTWLQRLDTSILYQDQSPEAEDKSYTLLDRNTEAPTPGTVIAIDAEFVLAKDFEYAVNSDGEKETIRPRIHSLGRVSVVRASGDRRGVPFIDDYINIKEPIVNYFTEFSGLTETDLDPKTSKHNLVPLKLAFKKLWLLLNLGCIFVGHGLRSDFRVINLQVPREQVHDTQELFWVEAQRRKLSLAFLAKSVLNLEIQGHMHDSIEDANTAQLLYWKYKELLESGRLHEELKKIYAFGVKHGFRPVKVAGQSAQRTETPPMVDDAQPGALLPYQPPELLQSS